MPITRIWDFSESRLQLVPLPSRKWATTNEETQYFSIDTNMRILDKLGIIPLKGRWHSCCLQSGVVYCKFPSQGVQSITSYVVVLYSNDRIPPQFDLKPNSMLRVIHQAQAENFIQLPKQSQCIKRQKSVTVGTSKDLSKINFCPSKTAISCKYS